MPQPVPQRRIPESFVQLLYDYLEARDIDPVQVLGACRPRVHLFDPGGYPIERWVQLLQAAADYLRDPLLGLKLGQQVAPHHLGVMGYLLLSSRNLGAAAQRLYQYQRLIYDVTPMELRVGAELDMAWDAHHGRPGPLVDETAISALVQFCRNLSDSQFQPVAVHFINPWPLDIEPYERFFGCPVLFDQPETIVRSSRETLALPVRTADRATLEMMERQADRLLQALPSDVPLLSRVRQFISRSLHEAEPSVGTVAGAMNCSARTLQRRLAEQGSSFRAELGLVRRQMAERYLADSRLGMVDIAMLLGYSEHSAFTRSFTRWNGISPSAYRARYAGKRR